MARKSEWDREWERFWYFVGKLIGQIILFIIMVKLFWAAYPIIAFLVVVPILLMAGKL